MLQTDAFGRGIGNVLSQLTMPEMSTSSLLQSETLAMADVIFHCRKGMPCYLTRSAGVLLGKPTGDLLGKPFTIQKDHRSLEWRNCFKNSNA